MRAHILFLSVVGSCVVVLAERSGESKPISNLQLLTQRLSPPRSTSPTTHDNVQVVKWLLRALHRYLYENGADDLEIEGPTAPEPEFITVVVEREDENEAEQRAQDDGEDENVPPMLPYVERDPRHQSQDFRLPYTQHRSQKRYKPLPYDDTKQRYKEYLQDLLEAEERDDEEDQTQHYRDASESQVMNLGKLQAGHSMNDHLKQLPVELQERVAFQAHVDHEKGCTWCAILRASGVAPTKLPSAGAAPPPPTPLKKKLVAALPDPWFEKMNGRRWTVLHEDYPGMMQEMRNLALDHREKKFRSRWSEMSPDK